MKFFLLVLSWLLLVENLQGSTLTLERPVRALNTTLRTNFSGIYQRKNPCSGSELETSSYKASQEFHHHTKDDCWSGYTHKCSAIIRNFLQSIGNLFRFNHEPNGSFNFYLNTSISQKQRISGNHKSCESLPTIVIEATDCKIPLNTYCHIPKARATKSRPLPSTNLSAQQNSRSPQPAPLDQKQRGAFLSEEAVSAVPFQCATPQYSTPDSGSEWLEAEENSREDISLPSTPSGPGESVQPEDFSQAVLYDLSRDTQSACEPKTKYFKTSLKLTPQTDPENGTINPRIHYMAANLVSDHLQPATQTETQNLLARPERPITFQEDPFHPTEPITLPIPSEYPFQKPPSTNAPSPQSFQTPNEPVPLSATSTPQPQLSSPSSQTESLPQTSSTPLGTQFSTPADLTFQPLQLPNGPSNDQISSVTIPSQYAQEISVMQFTPDPEAFDISSTSAPLQQNQPEDGVLQIIKEGYPEDLPDQAPDVNGEPLGYPLTLNPPPTAYNYSFASEPESLTFSDRIPDFGNLPAADKFSARQISSPRFPDLPSTISPPRENALFSNQLPDYSDPDSGEGKESNGVRSQTSVTPYEAALAPLSDPDPSIPSSSTPAGSPVNSDFNRPNIYSDQQPNVGGRSTVTTVVEETVTVDEKQTTPGFAADAGAGQISESISRTSDLSFPPGSDFTLYEFPQQSSSAAGPFSNVNMLDSSQSLANLDPSMSSLSPGTLANPEEVKPDTPPLMNGDYSEMDPRVPNAAFKPTQWVPEPLSTTEVPSLEPVLAKQYNLPTDGPSSLYMTTPIPYAEVPYPEQTAMNSPVAEEKPPSSAIADALSTQRPLPPGEPNYQTTFPQLPSTTGLVVADEPAVDAPLIGYSDRIGQRTPPASDSFVSGDYLTAAPPQAFTDKVDSLQPFPVRPFDGLPASTPESSVHDDSASVSQLTDSSLKKQPSLGSGFANSPAPYQLPFPTNSEGISESVSPSLPPSVTPSPEMYALRPQQQPFASTSDRRFQEQSFADRTSPLLSESAVTGGPDTVLSQEQFETDQNGRNNRANVLTVTTTYTEQDLQRSLQSVTPTYGVQSPDEADYPKSQPQILQNAFGEENPPDFPRLLGSAEQQSNGKQTTVSSAPSQPRSLDSEFSDRSPATFSDYGEATIPADFPPAAQHPNREFGLDRPSALPDSFATSLPAGEQLQETTPRRVDFQESSTNSSPEFSNDSSQRLSTDLPFLVSPQPNPFTSDRPSTQQLTPPIQSVDRFTEMAPQQPLRSAPLSLAASSASNRELVLQPLLEEPESPFRYSRPLPSETDPSTDSSVPPQLQKGRTSYETTAIPETITTTTVPESDRFSIGSTEAPLPDSPQTLSETIVSDVETTATSPLPPSTIAGEVLTTLQQSLLPSEPPQPPNYRHRSPEESPDSVVPLASQQIQIPVTNYGSSAMLQQQLQSPQTSALIVSTVPMPTVPPETALNYPDQESLQSAVSGAVEPRRSLEEQELQNDFDLVSSPVPPPFGASESLAQNSRLRTLPQVNFQQQAQQLSEPLNSATLKTQPPPDAVHARSPTGFPSSPIPNSYDGYLRTPPEAPYFDLYPGQHPNSLPHLPQNRPFHAQQPVPQTVDSQPLPPAPYNFPPNHQLIAQQVAAPEARAQSSASETQPRFPPPRAQSTTSADRPVVVPPPHLRNIPNPSDPIPPLYPTQIPSYNDFPTRGPLRPFPSRPYPLHNHRRLQPPSRTDLPSHPDARMNDMLTMNQFVDDRQFIPPQENYPILRPNFDSDYPREADIPEDADMRPPLDAQAGFPLRPQTAFPPYGLPPELPPPALRPPSPQQLQPYLLPPTQEPPYPYTSFPGHSDHHQPLPFHRQNLTHIDTSPAAPPHPPQWNPRTATNFVNFQNTALVGVPNRPLPDPRPLPPLQTTPSNEPGEDSVPYCGRDTPLLCLFDPASRGNMTAPSYVILISHLPGDAHGEESVRVEKVYLGGGTLLNCTWGANKTFPTALYAPAPSAAAATVTLHPIPDFA